MFHIKEGTNPTGVVRLGWQGSYFGLRWGQLQEKAENYVMMSSSDYTAEHLR